MTPIVKTTAIVTNAATIDATDDIGKFFDYVISISQQIIIFGGVW
jgi:hypothetical protein